MAGVFSPEKSGTDFLTNFVLHRTVTQTDPAVANVTETLDLSRSSSARANTIVLIPKQIAGAASRVKFEFYLKLVNAPAGLTNQWILVSLSPWLNYLEIGTFSNLMAGVYKIRAICETPATSYEIYLAHNQYLPQS